MGANVPIYFEQGGAKLVVGDGGTIEVQAGGTIDGAGSIDVPDGSITAEKLAADSVITEKILDDNVTQDKLADDSVGTDQILDDAVTTDKILDDAVTADKVAVDAIFTDNIADEAVTFAKALTFFTSMEQTADGMAQNIAHGLGVAPSAVIVTPTSNVGLMNAEFDIAWAADMTNVTVTATTGLTYYVLAWG